MSFADEFAVIDMIAASQLPTRAVDAFALSIIKMERQMRRLFTYLIFQSDAFDATDVEALRNILSTNDKVYFEGFERGINALYQSSVEQMVGAEYEVLRPAVSEAVAVRNKIFHGQLRIPRDGGHDSTLMADSVPASSRTPFHGDGGQHSIWMADT
ncbi:hypothetical protein [Cupriavidus oxalaticus]|uniref:Uncharacterized protein n=1 Tax=Cupriavidus oxalaticus TaxID=96344 RepID=A0A5P3VFH3_9BURK|nr:hypothetical protein [Cupriavidus oxalaticus]QEZ44122.1 hypothetical protein D2917_07660 [Cupriavidus oxalaticus]